jgi:hypothetical protein
MSEGLGTEGRRALLPILAWFKCEMIARFPFDMRRLTG